MTNLTNPKAAVFFGSILAPVLDGAEADWVVVAAIAVIVVNALWWHCLLAVLFARPPVRRWYARAKRVIDRVVGGLLVLLGVRLGAEPLLTAEPPTGSPVRGQRDLDVAAGGVGVGADLVGRLDQLDRGARVGDRRQGHVHRDSQVETPPVVRDELDPRVHLGVVGLQLLPACHHGQRALETGGEARREELFGVRPGAVSPELLRRPDLDLERSVVGDGVPVGPPAPDLGPRGVEDLAHEGSD